MDFCWQQRACLWMPYPASCLLTLPTWDYCVAVPFNHQLCPEVGEQDPPSESGGYRPKYCQAIDAALWRDKGRIKGLMYLNNRRSQIVYWSG